MFGCWVSQPFGLWQLRKREKYCRYSANKPAKKSPSQPTAPRTGTTPVHRRRAGRKLCRLTRDPAERPLAYDLRRLRAAAPQHHRRAPTPLERGTACTLRRSCGASLQHRRRAATPPDCRLGCTLSPPAAPPERRNGCAVSLSPRLHLLRRHPPELRPACALRRPRGAARRAPQCRNAAGPRYAPAAAPAPLR